jgi:hypothetical protein
MSTSRPLEWYLCDMTHYWPNPDESNSACLFDFSFSLSHSLLQRLAGNHSMMRLHSQAGRVFSYGKRTLSSKNTNFSKTLQNQTCSNDQSVPQSDQDCLALHTSCSLSQFFPYLNLKLILIPTHPSVPKNQPPQNLIFSALNIEVLSYYTITLPFSFPLGQVVRPNFLRPWPRTLEKFTPIY